jgi:hypothetical protein
VSGRMELVEGTPRRHLIASVRELVPSAGRSEIRRTRHPREVQANCARCGMGCDPPLAFMAIFTLTIGPDAEVSEGDVPSAAFSLSALVPWAFPASGPALDHRYGQRVSCVSQTGQEDFWVVSLAPPRRPLSRV